MGTFNLFMYKVEEYVLEGQQPDRESRALNHRMTKKEMKEIQEEFHRQKEVYESRHRVLMSEERKKALYR